MPQKLHPCWVMNPMRLTHGTLSVWHTSGIRGLSMFPVAVSSVTTVPDRAIASPTTKGSAALRPLPTPISSGCTASTLDQHLEAVDELSREWNWYPLDDEKVILVELVPRRAQPTGFLPQRAAGSFFYPEPDAPVAPFRNMALTQRVLDGLRRLGVEGEAR
jgi:hypothetical protein